MELNSNEEPFGGVEELLSQSIKQQEEEYIKIVQLFQQKNHILQIIISNIVKDNPDMIEVIKNFPQKDMYNFDNLLEMNENDNEIFNATQDSLAALQQQQIIQQDQSEHSQDQQKRLIINSKDQNDQNESPRKKLPCQYCKRFFKGYTNLVRHQRNYHQIQQTQKQIRK
ncbi:hypothetical protein pb186bvf_015632 [Paramecium bursaria]